MRHTLDHRLRRDRLARVALIVTLATVALTAAAGASARNTLTVCPAGPPECQFATVQEALIAAQNGDRILIAPGSYSAGFTVDKNVSLIGSGATETTLSGGAVGVTIAAGSTVDIRGLTVSDAIDTGIFNLGTLTLRNSTSAANGLGRVSGPGGVLNSGTLALSHSTVRDNASGVFAGGIENDGALMLRDSAVVRNSGGWAGGIRNNGSATVKRSTIESNGSMGPGNIENSGQLELRNSTVAGGVCESACALFNQSGATALVINTVVSGNSSQSGAVTNGGILTIRGGEIRGNEASFSAPGAIENRITGVATIKHTRIADNHNLFQSGPGAIGNDGHMTLEDTDVVGNSGGGGGGVYNRGSGILMLWSSAVRENTAEAIGGGILNEGTAQLRHSVVTGNIAVNGLNGLFGGGIYNTGTITLGHSSVRGNIPDDCFGC